jgi:hypothetical protein
MEQLAIVELVQQLFVAIHMLSGYPVPSQIQRIERTDPSRLLAGEFHDARRCPSAARESGEARCSGSAAWACCAILKPGPDDRVPSLDIFVPAFDLD